MRWMRAGGGGRRQQHGNGPQRQNAEHHRDEGFAVGNGHHDGVAGLNAFGTQIGDDVVDLNGDGLGLIGLHHIIKEALNRVGLQRFQWRRHLVSPEVAQVNTVLVTR